MVVTVYKSLMNDLRLLMNSLGIPSTVRFEDRSHIENWQDLYKINLSNVLSVKKWDMYIASYSLKYNSTRNKSTDIGWNTKIDSGLEINYKLWNKKQQATFSINI